jgi:DNA-binding CsgD family transcriptional regulator
MATDSSRALSARERQVLWLTAWGYSAKQIAERLCMSDKSVTTYKERGLKKLSLKTRVDIVRYANAQGWFQESDPEREQLLSAPDARH